MSAVSFCICPSGIFLTNHKEWSLNGSDWTQVKGRSTGSLGLSLTGAYSLGDPQKTANDKKKVWWPKFKKIFFVVGTLFFQFKSNMISVLLNWIFLMIIVVYYYKFIYEESPSPKRRPCTSEFWPFMKLTVFSVSSVINSFVFWFHSFCLFSTTNSCNGMHI